MHIRLSQRYINDEWINESREIYRYNLNQNLISEVYQAWEDQWVNDDSTHAYYSISTGIKDLIRDESEILLYPNPATNLLHFKSREASLQEMTIEIFSDSGVKVKHAKLKSGFNQNVDISGLIPGSYHVLIQSETGITIRNFVKQ